MIDIESRINRAKANLVVDQPYFGTIVSYFSSKQNDDIEKYKSTLGVFEYNDTYINSLSEDELSFVLTSVAMHQALSHELRRENRMPWLWELSKDYAINALLVNNGFEPPDSVNYDFRFDDMSAEAIYTILENEIDDNSDVHHTKDIKYEPQKYEEEQYLEFEDVSAQLLNRAKLIGDMPLGIDILVPRIKESKINWRDELYECIESAVKFDYSLLPPNKRFQYLGVALPSLSSNVVKIVVAIDSSGSVDGSMLSAFLSEVESIMNSFENFEIDLIVADAKVHEHHIITPGDELSYTLKGGGGTNFENTFKYIDENIDDVTLLLYFTDGMGNSPKDEPNYECVWAMSENEISVPFGRVVLLK